MSITSRTSSIIIIGNEILSGRTQELNSRFLAQRLLSIGIKVYEVRIIPDNKNCIINCINNLRKKYKYVFTSGGIGPTHDDITAECVANAFNVELPIHIGAKKILEDYYKTQNIKLNNARLRMARIPKGAIMISNPISAAPGFQIENVFVLAGVPKIFKAMVENIIEKLGIETSIISKTIILNKQEGEIAENLALIASQFPDVSIGSYPFEKNEIKGTNIVVTCTDKKLTNKIATIIGELKK